jgi:hypothetical protein
VNRWYSDVTRWSVVAVTFGERLVDDDPVHAMIVVHGRLRQPVSIRDTGW